MHKGTNCVLTVMTALLAAGCNEGEEESVIKSLVIGNQSYQIAEAYVLSELPSAMVPRGREMDTDSGINLEIPLADLGVAALPYEHPSSDAAVVRVLLYGPAAFTYANEYRLNPDAYDAWMKLGNYQRDRVVEKDENTGLFRIYWRRGAKSWQLFENEPSEVGGSTPPRWVAACYSQVVGPEAEDASNVRCSTQVSMAEGDVDITFSGLYVTQTDEIVQGVRSKIVEWTTGTDSSVKS